MRRFRNFLVTVLLSAFWPAVVGAQVDWDPSSVDNQPFDSIDLLRTQSVLYLTAKCEVLAFVVPTDSALGSYLPAPANVRNRWWERKNVYGKKGTCMKPAKFLDLKLEPGIGMNANACKPNVYQTDAQLPGNACRWDNAALDTVVLLDTFHEPVLILEGKLAITTAKTTVPAVFLGRGKEGFESGAPCSPTVPSPCLPPKQGVLKYINGQQVCVCQ